MRTAVILGIANNALAYSAKEIANTFWTLGKMHFTFRADSSSVVSHSLKTSVGRVVFIIGQQESDVLAVVSQNDRFSVYHIENISVYYAS